MITKKLKTDELSYNETLKESALILNSSGIVAIPTETVYGLAASALDKEAIDKIFIAKGRPQDNPLIVHIAEISALTEIAKDIPEIAITCAERFWPGPFTMVLKRTDKTAENVSAGLGTVAIRMPSNKIALDIIKEAGVPLAAPSANSSGKPSPTTADHVYDDLSGKIDAIVYGEKADVGVESTVVSFVTNPPRLLRPGAVTAEQLRELIPDLVVDKAVLSEPEENEEVHSPGMKYKHYAPKTKAILIEADREKFIEFVNKQSAAVICFQDEIENIKNPSISYGNSDNELTLAQNVFEALREIDNLNMEKVFIHAPSKKGVGLAVYNRLIRAAGFQVIKL